MKNRAELPRFDNSIQNATDKATITTTTAGRFLAVRS